MPKLKVLTTCEKVILDVKGIPSLINIFQRMDVQFVPNVMIDPEAVIPVRWYVFSLWQLSDDEVDRDYMQHIQISAPDGRLFVELNLGFRVNSGVPDMQIRSIAEVNGLPVGKSGKVLVKTWLIGEEDKIYDCEFVVNQVPQADSQIPLALPKQP